MATVSNNSPFTEIQPLRVPSNDYPNLKLGLTRVALIFATTAFGAATGATIGLSGAVITVIPGAIVGGVIGLIAGIVLAYFLKIPSSIGQYRFSTLKQIEDIYQSNTRVLHAVRYLKKIFSVPFKGFRQTYLNHDLHNEITVVTKVIDSHRPDVKKVWEVFLNHLHNKRVVNADGHVITLDFGIELEWLEGEKISIQDVEFLKPESASYDGDLKQIEDLQKESFGEVGTFSKEQLKRYLAENPLNQCVVIRREKTNEILGFAWTLKHAGSLSLVGLARRPGAAYLGIGNRLMAAILYRTPENQPLQLYVRKSNPAVALYERWGFEKIELPGYYPSGPPEPAYKMTLNWETYREIRKKIPQKAA